MVGGLNWAEEAEREEAERRAAEEEEAKAEAARAEILLQQQQQQQRSLKKPQNPPGNPAYGAVRVLTRNLHDAGILPERPAAPVILDRRRDPLPAPASRADRVQDWRGGRKNVAGGAGGESPRILQNEAPRPAISARVRVDPFGGARPREDVLAEKESKLKSIDTPKLSKDEPRISLDSVVDPFTRLRIAASEAENKPKNLMISETEKPVLDVETNPRYLMVSEAEMPLSEARHLITSESHSKPRKVNPFGEAKPREVVLAERGFDYQKIDFELQHRSIARSESEEEVKLKDEIHDLERLIKDLNIQNRDVAKADILRVELKQKEKQLQELTLFLDDQVRFPKKGERPISRSGRSDTSSISNSTSDQIYASQVYIPQIPASHLSSIHHTRDTSCERPHLGFKERGILNVSEYARHGTEARVYQNNNDQDSSFERRDFRADNYSSRRGMRPGRPPTPLGDMEYPGYDSERSSRRSASWVNDYNTYELERPTTSSWDGDSVSSDYDTPVPASGSGFKDMSDVSVSGRKIPAGGDPSSSKGYDIEGRRISANETPRRSVFDRLGPRAMSREYGEKPESSYDSEERRPWKESRIPSDTHAYQSEKGRVDDNGVQAGNRRNRGKRGSSQKRGQRRRDQH